MLFSQSQSIQDVPLCSPPFFHAQLIQNFRILLHSRMIFRSYHDWLSFLTWTNLPAVDAASSSRFSIFKFSSCASFSSIASSASSAFSIDCRFLFNSGDSSSFCSSFSSSDNSLVSSSSSELSAGFLGLSLPCVWDVCQLLISHKRRLPCSKRSSSFSLAAFSNPRG